MSLPRRVGLGRGERLSWSRALRCCVGTAALSLLLLLRLLAMFRLRWLLLRLAT